MNVTIEHAQDLPIVAVSGRLDTVTAPAFDLQVAPLLQTPRPRILLDLSQVVYISSAGLRSVLQLIKHATAQGGRLAICGAQPAIMEVIEISGFPALVDLYPDRESALTQKPA